MMPTETASTTWSKSTPRRRTRVSASARRPKCDSACAVRHRRELLGQRPVGEHRQAPDRRQWFVVFDAVGQAGLPPDRDGVDGVPVSVQMQAVDPVEELESDTAPAQYLIQRRDHDVTHPRRHLPEHRAPVSEQDVADQEDHQPRGHRGSFGIGVLIAEHQVVQAAHHRRIQHVGMAAVTQDPVAELFVVERPEAAGTGHHVVGDDAAHRGGHQREQHPRPAVARPGLVVDRVADGDQRAVEEILGTTDSGPATSAASKARRTAAIG